MMEELTDEKINSCRNTKNEASTSPITISKKLKEKLQQQNICK